MQFLKTTILALNTKIKLSLKNSARFKCKKKMQARSCFVNRVKSLFASISVMRSQLSSERKPEEVDFSRMIDLPWQCWHRTLGASIEIGCNPCMTPNGRVSNFMLSKSCPSLYCLQQLFCHGVAFQSLQVFSMCMSGMVGVAVQLMIWEGNHFSHSNPT